MFTQWLRTAKARASLRTGKNRWPIGAGVVLLCAVSGLAGAQTAPPAPTPTQPIVSPPVRPKKAPVPVNDLAGLKFTDEQQARIDQIRDDEKSRIAVVAKDDKLSPEQKSAMILGIQHMERRQIYQVLTREQQTEVRKRVVARREAGNKEQEKKNPSSHQ